MLTNDKKEWYLPKRAHIKALFKDITGIADYLEPIVKKISGFFGFEYEMISEINFDLYDIIPDIGVYSELIDRPSGEKILGEMIWHTSTGVLISFKIIDSEGRESSVVYRGEY